MMNKLTAILTGISGQDGSHLVEQLIDEDDYNVVGIVRRSSTPNLSRIQHMVGHPNLTLEYGDVLDQDFLSNVFKKYQPQEIYHLAAQSHVGLSFTLPDYTYKCIVSGTFNVLNAAENNCPNARVYHASSSEQMGRSVNPDGYQNEDTPFEPLSPYAVAKVAAHNLTKFYNDTNRLKTSCGILYNHEGPRRGEEFVTRKITKYIGELLRAPKLSSFRKLFLGNLDAKRDWGFSPDYCTAMRLMLRSNQERRVYVVATGETHTIREFLEEAFGYVELDYKDFVAIDQSLFRRNDVPLLLGDSSRIQKDLGWKPSVTFKELVQIMVKADATKETNTGAIQSLSEIRRAGL